MERKAKGRVMYKTDKFEKLVLRALAMILHRDLYGESFGQLKSTEDATGEIISDIQDALIRLKGE